MWVASDNFELPFLQAMARHDADYGLGLGLEKINPQENNRINRDLIALSRAIGEQFRDSVRKKGKYGNPKEWMETICKIEAELFGNRQPLRGAEQNSKAWGQFRNAGGHAKGKSFMLECLRQHTEAVSQITGAIARNKEQHRGPEMGGGVFKSPVILNQSMHSRKDRTHQNFPDGIGPRWQKIVDYICRNGKNWQSGYIHSEVMARFPKGFEKDTPFQKHKGVGVYEIFRIVKGNTSKSDQRDVLMVRVGFSNGLHFQNNTRNGPGDPPLWEYSYDGPMDYNEDGALSARKKAEWMATNPGNEGLHLFRIQPSVVTMQTANKNPMALEENYLKMGDYVVLIGDAPRDDYNECQLNLTTVPSNLNHNIHDFVKQIVPNQKYQFLHLTQMSVALGDRAWHPGRPDAKAQTKAEWPFASDRAKDLIGNPKTGSVKIFEPMTPNELLSVMMGISVGINEGEIMEAETMEEQKATEFIPTWKDNRPKKTVSKTKGIPHYTDVIRCSVCNGRNLVRLPKTPPYENVECGHCGAPEGVITIHLNSESPGVEIEEPQPFR